MNFKMYQVFICRMQTFATKDNRDRKTFKWNRVIISNSINSYMFSTQSFQKHNNIVPFTIILSFFSWLKEVHTILRSFWCVHLGSFCFLIPYVLLLRGQLQSHAVVAKCVILEALVWLYNVLYMASVGNYWNLRPFE